MENIFILIPTAPGLIDNEAIQEKYFDIVMQRLEDFTGESIRDCIVYKRNFATQDFIKDYHAHKGNAYGLANTLLQTGPLKPRLVHQSLKNMVLLVNLPFQDQVCLLVLSQANWLQMRF